MYSTNYKLIFMLRDFLLLVLKQVNMSEIQTSNDNLPQQAIYVCN